MQTNYDDNSQGWAYQLQIEQQCYEEECMSKKEKETLPAPEMSAIERVMIEGDLSRLTTEQRVLYYKQTCDSLGLNYLTRPFDYIVLNGKMQLYARKDCTEQLRKIRGISFTKIETRQENGVYIVTAYANDKEGRTDVSTGAVNFGKLQGDALANAIMKAETKAKRRVTLSIAGLGWLDESEVATIPDAKIINEAELPKPCEVQVIPHVNIENDMLASYKGAINATKSEKELFELWIDVYKKVSGDIDLLAELTQQKNNKKSQLQAASLNGVGGSKHA